MFCSNCGNKCDNNSSFCPNCGKMIRIINNSNNNSNKKMIILGLIIGIILVLILFLIFGIVNVAKDRYYFGKGIDNPVNNPVETPDDGSITETVIEKTPKKNKYSTVIVYDHVYNGVKINNKLDAFDLIIKDSVNQKSQCPTDIKAIEDEIINKYGITAVNLCELDPNFAREIGNVFRKVYDEFPGARGYITNLTLVNGSLQNSYIAAFMPVFNFATSDTASTYPWVIKTHVLLNTSYFLNVDRLESAARDGSSSSHFPKNSTIYSPVAHELGHYLSFLALMKKYYVDSILLIDDTNISSFYKLYDDFAKGDYSLSMITEAYQKYKNDTNTTMSLDEWRGTISNYALAKDNSGNYIYDETIAEAFHDVYLNGDNASIASKYVVSVLKEKLGSR